MPRIPLKKQLLFALALSMFFLAGVTVCSGQQPSAATASAVRCGDPIACLKEGNALLARGSFRDAYAYWDKGIELGGAAKFSVCRNNRAPACDQGLLSLSASAISLTDSTGKGVFHVIPSHVGVSSVQQHQGVPSPSLLIRIATMEYSLDVVPFGVQCRNQPYLQCPPQATNQQRALATYIAVKLQRLAQGSSTGNEQPQADTILIETDSGPVRVKNFYRSSKGPDANGGVFLEKTPSYVIAYDPQMKCSEDSKHDGCFSIDLVADIAIKADQLRSEQLLMTMMGVPRSDFCKLPIVVMTLEDKITGSKVSTPPSLCPNGQLHFSDVSKPEHKGAGGQREDTVLALLRVTEGTDVMVLPFMQIAKGKYTPLPYGSTMKSVEQTQKSDFLPSGEPNLKSPHLVEAIRQSPLRKGISLDTYRAGKNIGTCEVAAVNASYVDTPNLHIVGHCGATTPRPPSDDMAAIGNISHNGLWPDKQLTSSQKSSLKNEAVALWPKTVPKNRAMPTLVGKSLKPSDVTEKLAVLDLNKNGEVQAFIELSATMSVGATKPIHAEASLLASYDNTRKTWLPIMKCSYVGDSESIAGDKTCSMIDVFEINGDVAPKLLILEGGGEVGDLVLYEFNNKQLKVITKIEGWTGS